MFKIIYPLCAYKFLLKIIVFIMLKFLLFDFMNLTFLLNFPNSKIFKQNYIKIKELSLELVDKVRLHLKYL